MKFSEKIDAHSSHHPFYTFEFFPPKTDQGFENLSSRISRLSTLNPLGISITWGAGGSTKDHSLELAAITQNTFGIDTLLHLTCTNMEKGSVDEALKLAKNQGIQNILALRGDPPRGQEEWKPIDPQFTLGVDLIRFIRQSPEYGPYFCIGVAAYPDGHADGLSDEDTEIMHLKEKVDAGADFIITQLFYDAGSFLAWLQKVRNAGITIPVIPGIMPIQTYASFARVTKLCGTRVPPVILSDLEAVQHDDSLVKEYGIKLAVDIVRRVTSEGKVPGVHFCTLNLEKSVRLIIEKLQWHIPIHHLDHNRLIAENMDNPIPHQLQVPEDMELVITPVNAMNEANLGLGRVPSRENEAGRGELNQAESWDEFPNGRFGDVKSPAFGQIEPWGSMGISLKEPPSQWGHPTTTEDLTKLFLDHLHSKINSTPFSQGTLSPESRLILPYLEKLTRRGWWTVGSQPAINGACSTDELVGWGPKGGYVFQKSFVEFFCDEDAVKCIEDAIRHSGNGLVHWFAGTKDGNFRTNVPMGGRNAVTWGIFPGKEIVQTTIIEQDSFLAWKDEAFSIWSDWSSFYSPTSQERRLLQHIRDRHWLVSLVHHDYQDPEALWNYLSQEVL